MTDQKIRTLGLYQPYATLMLHGKIETRWVEVGKKPPFPLGMYLLYSTKKDSSMEDFHNTSGMYCASVWEALSKPVHELEHVGGGSPIAIGTLNNVRKYIPGVDGPKTFVDSVDGTMHVLKNGESKVYTLWCLEFIDVSPVQYFSFNGGKQGIGFLSDEDRAKIQIV